MKRFLPLPRELALAPQLAVLDLLDVTLHATATVLVTEYPRLDEALTTRLVYRNPCEQFAHRIILVTAELRDAMVAYRAFLRHDQQFINHDDPDLPF